MVKRKRGKSVKNNKNQNLEPEELVQAPHSFVIHRGLPGGHVIELTRDFRRVMEPFTASTLKENKNNTLKDFVSIAGPLHVSHLCVFSRTETGMYLKLARLPRGPTLTFKVTNFSLARDVISSLKKQLVIEQAFKHSPLIVMNSFSGEGMHMKLMATMFQNMYPTINLANVDLNTIRRCVLVNYNPTTKLIDFRHFTIKVAPVGISKGTKKIVGGKVPNLSKFNDISDFMTKSGMLSESEIEDDPMNHVTLPQKIISRGNMESGKSAVRLTELGPRLTLQLIKIEDGLLDGQVLYHELIEKTEEEKVQIQKKRLAKKKLKENRRKVQEENKERKDAKKQEHKTKSLRGMRKETDELMRKASRESQQDNPVEDDDDAEYYREEVGEEPEQDLFSQANRGTKRPHLPHYAKSKKPRMDIPQKGDRKSSFGGKDSRFSSKTKTAPGRGDRKRTFAGRDSRFSGRDKTGPERGDRKSSVGGRGNKFAGKDKGVGGRSFGGKEKKFSNRKNKGEDKINSRNRDHRPIGGKSGVRKFAGKSKR